MRMLRNLRMEFGFVIGDSVGQAMIVRLVRPVSKCANPQTAGDRNAQQQRPHVFRVRTKYHSNSFNMHATSRHRHGAAVTCLIFIGFQPLFSMSFSKLFTLVTTNRAARTCNELVLKIMDAGYCLYVHIFMKNIKSLKPFNFYNSNQHMPDLRFQQSRRDN